jgi:hypothetical protein
MPASETARLIASLELKDLFSPNANKIGKSLGTLDRQIDGTQGRAYKAGTQIGVGIKRGAYIAAGAITFLGSQVILGLKQLGDLEDATTATNAALKSTKGVSGQTAASIRNLAEQYEGLNAIIDDKVIQSGENVLLTFTAIRKEAFEPALKAALDLSVGMKQDLQTSIVQVGKALNDPIKGLTSLSRIGVRFTDQQKEQIKALVKTGDLLGAQKIILAELGTEFGGRFAAQGKTAKGAIAGIGDAVEDLQKALATGLFPVVQKVLPKIRAFLTDKAFLDGAKKLGDSIAGLFSDENIAEGGKILSSMFNTAKAAAPVLKSAAEAMFTVVKAAVGLFRSLPEGIQQIAIGAFAINKLTGGLVTNVAGGIAEFLARKFTGGMNVTAGVVNVTGGAGLGGGIPGSGSRVGGIVSAVGKVFLVGMAVGVLAELKNILDDQSKRNKEQASDLAKQTAAFTKSATLLAMKNSLAGIDTEIERLSHGFGAENLAFQFNIDGVRDAVLSERKALVDAIKSQQDRAIAMSTKTKDDTTNAIKDAGERQRDAIESVRIAILSQKPSGGRSEKLQFGPGGSSPGGGLPAGSGGVFVPTVTLDPSVIKDLRFDTRGERAAIRNAVADALRSAKTTLFPGKIADDAGGRPPNYSSLIKETNKDLVSLTRKVDSVGHEGQQAAFAIRDRITSAKTAQVSAINAARNRIAAASRYAGQQTASAIKDKDLSVTVPVRVTIPVTTSITLRETIKTRQTYLRFGNIRTGFVAG